MTKDEIRRTYRERRQSLAAHERDRMDDLMLIRFQSAQLPFIHILLSYMPIMGKNEPSTHLAEEYLRFRNPDLRIAYPVADFDKGEMRAVLTDPDTPFTSNQYGISEPGEGLACAAHRLDMVFVPLLAFDATGYRVGYGKGFYDRYLASCSRECLRVGFSYFEATEINIPRDEFDVPLDLCITPQHLYVF